VSIGARISASLGCWSTGALPAFACGRGSTAELALAFTGRKLIRQPHYGGLDCKKATGGETDRPQGFACQPRGQARQRFALTSRGIEQITVLRNGNNKMPSARDWSNAVRGAKRDLLLNAARDEFVDKGLEGATMRGIALRAGCTTGAIYPLFDSKEAIYAALLEQSLLLLDQHVADAIARVQGTKLQVEAACRAFLEYYLSHRFEVNLGLYAFRGLKRQGVGKKADRLLNQALWKVLQRIADPLAEARGIAVMDVRPMVALLFSQMIGALVLQIAGRLEFLEIDARELLRLLLQQLWTVSSLPLNASDDAAGQGRARKPQAKSM
jgi:AcrR family transcriptional regulator